jgi:hypothetical protein
MTLRNSFALSYVVEPGYHAFAKGIKIDDDAIFVQNGPFCDDPDIEEFLGYTGNEGLRAMILREKSLFTIGQLERLCREHIEDTRVLSRTKRLYC